MASLIMSAFDGVFAITFSSFNFLVWEEFYNLVLVFVGRTTEVVTSPRSAFIEDVFTDAFCFCWKDCNAFLARSFWSIGITF